VPPQRKRSAPAAPLTNDSDFVPLCRMLKQLGANVGLIRLSEARPVNEEPVEGFIRAIGV